MNAMRGFAAAAVFESATPAGIIACSSGSATLAPTPRSTVLRLRCFFRSNIAVNPLWTAPSVRGSYCLAGRALAWSRHLGHLESVAPHDAEHDRRQAIVLLRGIA